METIAAIDRENLFALINTTEDLVWSVDLNFNLVTSNKTFDAMIVKLRGHEIVNGTTVLATGFSELQLETYKKLYLRAFGGETFKETICNLLPENTWAEISFHPIVKNGIVVGTACFSHNITVYKKAEELLLNTQHLYAFLGQVNQAIWHTKDENTLLVYACRTAVDTAKFQMAGILIKDEHTGVVNIVANMDIPPFDMQFLMDLANNAENPYSRVVQSGKPSIINDFGLEPEGSATKTYCEKRVFKSFIAMPISKSGRVIGAFVLATQVQGYFVGSILNLLREATGDISFALEVFEKERLRKFMEEKVKQSEARMKQAQGIAHIGSWEYDISTGLTKWSEETAKIFGLDPVELTKPHKSYLFCLSFIHPDDLVYVRGVLGDSFRMLGNTAFFHRIKRATGETRHVYTQSQFEFDNDGKPVCLNGVTHDVTEMKETEISLAQSEANMRQIIDLIPQSVFVKDKDGKFVFVNKRFADLYGVKPTQLIHKTMLDTIPVKEEAEAFIKMDKDVIESGQSKTIPEHSFTDYKGEKHFFTTIKVPFVVPSTNEKAVLGVLKEITEQKKLEGEKAKIIADIVQRNKDLEQFSYIVSHNLRAPVANILGLVDILNREGQSKEDELFIKESLSTATHNLDTVIRDINRILDLKQVLGEDREVIVFSTLLKEVKISIFGIGKNNCATISGNFLEAGEIKSVKSYLYSIFYNLIANSLKYKRSGVPSVITITSKKEGNKLWLTFKDNGLGIDLYKNGEYLFGLYKRFHTHTEGKGMGLFMVKTQVEAMGGKITAKSAINEGCEFKIEFDI